MYSSNNVSIIGIAGGSASGKTTVSKKILESLDSKCSISIIKHDDYYKDRSHLTPQERLKINYDHPNSLDNDLLLQDLISLKNKKPINKPLYDFKDHIRLKEKQLIQPKNIIIVEGILTLWCSDMRDLFDIKVFVQTPPDICFIRRLKRDIELRNRDLDSVVENYLNVVRVMHQEFVEPSKEFADVIIPMGGDNKVAIDLLVTKIKALNNKHKNG